MASRTVRAFLNCIHVYILLLRHIKRTWRHPSRSPPLRIYEGPSNYKDFIPELTTKGYGVVLPELLGYGETDKPTNVEAYAFNPMCRQIAGILDAEGVQTVVGLGHDFGENPYHPWMPIRFGDSIRGGAETTDSIYYFLFTLLQVPPLSLAFLNSIRIG